MKKLILNSAVNAALPDEKVEVGKAFAIQLAPVGKYPQFIEDPDNPGQQKEVLQILDEQAMNTLVKNFDEAKAEAEKDGKRYAVLVDADHSSEIPGANGEMDTRASAWVTRLYVDPEKGLMAEIDPTSKGVEEINGKVYRFVSGAWTLDDDGRPEKLVSIGLTNKPNLPVAPIINAEANKNLPGTVQNAPDGVTDKGSSANADAQKGTQAANPPGGDNHNPQPAAGESGSGKEGQTNMNLKQKLGLPEEATDAEVEAALDALIAKGASMNSVREALNVTDENVTNEEVVNAVTELVNTCKTLNAEVEEAKTAKLNAEAEELVTSNEDVIPEDMVEEIKEQYVEDPEAAKATVANFRKVHDRAVLNATKSAKSESHIVINAQTAKKPVAMNTMASILGETKDPKAINAAIAKMAKRG